MRVLSYCLVGSLLLLFGCEDVASSPSRIGRWFESFRGSSTSTTTKSSVPLGGLIMELITETTTTTIPNSVEEEGSLTTELPNLSTGVEKSDLAFDPSRFRQSLSQDQQQSCLTKLLCTVKPAAPPTKKTNYINDYAYLVKEFFDLVDVADIGPSVAEVVQSELEGVESIPKPKKKKKNKGKTGKDPIKQQAQSRNKFVIEISHDDESDEDREDEDEESKYNDKSKEVSLEDLVKDVKISASDLPSHLRGRRSLLSVEATKTLKRKMRLLRMETDTRKKLTIAGEIASTIRTPRQCRQLSSNIVTTAMSGRCPLTNEVMKYIQSNIRNNVTTQQSPITNLNKDQQDFIIKSTESGEAQVIGPDPSVANTFVATDLKNPSVPNRFESVETNQQEEEKEENNEDRDEDKDEEKDEDKDEKEDKEEEDDEESDKKVDSGEDEEDDDNDEEQDEEDEEDEEEEAEEEKKVEKYKKKKKRKYRRPPPTMPPGTIRVYGIPQSSFDNDFTRVSGAIGDTVKLFDQDDYDSVLMSGLPDAKSTTPLPNYSYGTTSLRNRIKKKPKDKNNPHRYTLNRNRPKKTEERHEDRREEQIVIKNSAPKPTPYIPPFSYGVGANGPRPQEFYRQGIRPLYAQSSTPAYPDIQSRNPSYSNYQNQHQGYQYQSQQSYPYYQNYPNQNRPMPLKTRPIDFSPAQGLFRHPGRLYALPFFQTTTPLSIFQG